MYFYAKCMIQIGREKEEVGHQGWAKSVIFSKYYVHFLKIPIEAKLILKIIFFRQEHRSISGSVFFSNIIGDPWQIGLFHTPTLSFSSSVLLKR